MQDWLPHFGGSLTEATAVPDGTLSLALLGAFALILAYALLSVRRERLPSWLRLPVPATLVARLALLLLPAAGLPAAGLAVAQAGGSPAWLVAALLASIWSAREVVTLVTAVRARVDAAIGLLDPAEEPPAPPPGASREVRATFTSLREVHSRLADSYRQINHALRQGERLRRELMQVLESREEEIEARRTELREANADLERQTRTDALTGLANRRAFNEFLDRTWREATRDQKPLAVLMIDIDHFDAYREDHGPVQADACLQSVGEALGVVVGRAGDLVARYGGGRFAIILGNTSLEGGLRIGEELRDTIGSLAIPRRRPQGNLTVSVGVTSTVPSRGARTETVISAAGRALQLAAEGGPNRVGYSSPGRTGLFQSLCLPNDAGARPS